MDGALRLGRKIYSVFLALSFALVVIIGQGNSAAPSPEEETFEVVSTRPLKEKSIPETQLPPALASKASSRPNISSKFSNLEKIVQELDNAVTWNELRHFHNSVHRDFVQQLAQEEFDNGNPFHLPSQRGLWKRVLSQGLKDYSRKVYRSPHFSGGVGYDLVYYEILSSTGEKLYLLAYREKTTEFQSSLSKQPLATRIDLYSRSQVASENAEESWLLQIYRQNSEKSEDVALSTENFNASKQAILDMSTPLLTAGR